MQTPSLNPPTPPSHPLADPLSRLRDAAMQSSDYVRIDLESLRTSDAIAVETLSMDPVQPVGIPSVPALPAAVQAAMERNSRGLDLDPARLSQAISELVALRQPSDSTLRNLRFNLPPQANEHAFGTRGPISESNRSRGPADSASVVARSRPLHLASIREDFPALHQSIHGHPLIWLDNAATTHKPRSVIDAMARFYSHDYSNIHRAAHALAARATDHYESARQTVSDLINASSSDDIVFVRGTTEGINLVAHTIKGMLREGDEILVSEFEHHANIVPWQMISKETRTRLRVIPFDDSGELMIEEYRRLLGPRTRLVAVTHASNTLGTVLPIEEMTRLAHHHGAAILIDGAQSIAHMKIDVQAIGCDFFVFSGHKVFAPTGIGVVYMHPEIQSKLPPWQGGGNMIRRVTFDETTYADPPAIFEAGTPSIGDAVGLRAALDYLQQFDPAAVQAHEHALLDHAVRGLKAIPGVTIYGNPTHKIGVVSFTLDGYSTEQVGQALDRVGIAVRTGHHCAQPSLRHFGLESTVRPSFAIYNTHDEVDVLVDSVRRLATKRR